MSSKKSQHNHVDLLDCFRTDLGWVAMLGSGETFERPAGTLKRLTFGHRSREAALDALLAKGFDEFRRSIWHASLRRDLQNYARGIPVDFGYTQVDVAQLTPFQRAVVGRCRQIVYGSVLTYAQLATRAGSPRAARAVGNCMAANRFPIVVPCHRVVAQGGRLGGFSAPQGTDMKRCLLDLECHAKS